MTTVNTALAITITTGTDSVVRTKKRAKTMNMVIRTNMRRHSRRG